MACVCKHVTFIKETSFVLLCSVLQVNLEVEKKKMVGKGRGYKRTLKRE